MPMLKEMRTRRQRKLGLTALLTGLVTLVVVLTSTILLVASYQSKKESLIETTLHLNYTNANRMSQTVDSLFRSMRTSLEYSANVLSSVETMKTKEVDDYLELMRNSSNYFNSIALINADGLILNTVPKTLGMDGQYITSKSGKEALQKQAPYLSEPGIVPGTGRLILMMSEPLFNHEGHYMGVVGGTLYLHENNVLNMIIGNSAIDDSGSYYYIVGSDGHLLFHPDKARIGEDISSNPVVQRLLRGYSGQQQVINIKGVPMLAGYASVPANGWGVVVVSPTHIIQKQLLSHLKKVLWYTATPFFLLLIGVIILARKLARPFVYLADLVNRLGKEKVELSEIKPHWNREADLLNRAVLLALRDVQRQKDQLTQEAMTDLLTGLMNRRKLEQKMKEWIEEEIPFSLITMDVDKFKFVNDTYGHLAGDEVLKQVAGIITASVRPGDICGRYGGEEFIILLSRTRAVDAYIVAERIRKTLEKSDVPTAMRVTVSQGIAHYPSHAKSREELLQRADRALYSAKHQGRNKTIIAD